MKNIWNFLKSETVLAAAWVLALVTMVLVPPDGGYLDYIDWNTLMLLFSLMAVMAGLQRLGLFRRLGRPCWPGQPLPVSWRRLWYSCPFSPAWR